MINTIPLKTINSADFNSCEGGDPLFTQLRTFGADSLTLPKKLSAVSAADILGGILFWSRANRLSHPSGSIDKGGRWYPSDEEDPNDTVSNNYRTPSRTWPWSYMTACRTAEHCAELAGAEVSAVRKVKNFIEKSLASFEGGAEQEETGKTASVSRALQNTEDDSGNQTEIVSA